MKARRNTFVEEELWRAAREQSKKYIGCPHPHLGSASWYTRQALLEKLLRDVPTLKNIQEIELIVAKKRR